MRPGHLDLELRIPLSLAFCLHGPKYLGSPRLVGDTAFNDIIPGPKAETARKAGQRPARIRGGHTLRDSLDCGLCWAKEGILTSWHVVLSPVVTRAKLHSPPCLGGCLYHLLCGHPNNQAIHTGRVPSKWERPSQRGEFGSWGRPM